MGLIMIDLIKNILQFVVIFSFIFLSIIGAIQKDWNFGMAMNYVLALLYIVLYWRPL